MARVYDEKLRSTVLQVSEEIQCSASMKEGVYTMVSGPTFATPVEARYLRSQGSDAVGKNRLCSLPHSAHF